MFPTAIYILYKHLILHSLETTIEIGDGLDKAKARRSAEHVAHKALDQSPRTRMTGYSHDGEGTRASPLGFVDSPCVTLPGLASSSMLS